MNSCAYTDNDCSQLGERESSLTLPPSCIGNYLGRLARLRRRGDDSRLADGRDELAPQPGSLPLERHSKAGAVAGVEHVVATGEEHSSRRLRLGEDVGDHISSADEVRRDVAEHEEALDKHGGTFVVARASSRAGLDDDVKDGFAVTELGRGACDSSASVLEHEPAGDDFLGGGRSPLRRR